MDRWLESIVIYNLHTLSKAPLYGLRWTQTKVAPLNNYSRLYLWSSREKAHTLGARFKEKFIPRRTKVFQVAFRGQAK